MLTSEQRAEAERLFREHGFNGQLLIAPPVGDDERVFVLPTADHAALRRAGDLTQALQAVLRRKVWIVPACSDWPHTEPLR
jgi:hypothetical protein